jgi:hypothetical protein
MKRRIGGKMHYGNHLGGGQTDNFSQAVDLEEAAHAINDINFRKKRERREANEANRPKPSMPKMPWDNGEKS